MNGFLALCLSLALVNVVLAQRMEYNTSYVPGEGRGRLQLVDSCGCCGWTIRCYRNNGEFATDFNGRKELPNKLNKETGEEVNGVTPANGGADAKYWARCASCCGWSIWCWY